MKIHIGYIEGPFREFENIWAFHDEAAGACRVEFRAEYQFRSPILDVLIGVDVRDGVSKHFRGVRGARRLDLRTRSARKPFVAR